MKRITALEKEMLKEIGVAAKENKKQITLRCVDAIGSGRYSQYSVDRTSKYISFCEDKNLTAKRSNDAPRGGRLGNIVIVKIDKRNAFTKKAIQYIEGSK